MPPRPIRRPSNARHRSLLASLSLAFAPVPFPKPAKKDSDVTNKSVKGFHKLDYEKALARAKKDKKVVMIAFYADWWSSAGVSTPKPCAGKSAALPGA